MSLAIRDATLDGQRVGLRVEEQRIAAVGPSVQPEAGDDTLDAAGMALLPGLVNGHTRGDDADAWIWRRPAAHAVSYLWPTEAKLTAGGVYWGSYVSRNRSGTVRFWDMY